MQARAVAEEQSLAAVLFPVGLVGRGFASMGESRVMSGRGFASTEESRVKSGSFAEHEGYAYAQMQLSES